MNALQAHQVSTAVTATNTPLTVARTQLRANSCARRRRRGRARPTRFPVRALAQEQAHSGGDQQRRQARPGTRSARSSAGRPRTRRRRSGSSRARQHDAERRGGLHDDAGRDAPRFGHALGDQRRPDAPFAADAEARERADTGSAGRCWPTSAHSAGAQRVQRDGREQRPLAPDAIREPAEQHPAGRPAHQQHRGDGPGPEHHGAGAPAVSPAAGAAARDAVGGDEVEQQRRRRHRSPSRPSRPRSPATGSRRNRATYAKCSRLRTSNALPRHRLVSTVECRAANPVGKHARNQA